MSKEQKAYNEWLANQDELRHITNIGDSLEQAERELARLRAENAELRARLDKALDDMRTVTVTDINMRDLMELADRLDAHAQHPGFPQPPARVTNPDEPNGTCPTCGTIFGDGDPDEPVAGTG